jgi:hypothetical protein
MISLEGLPANDVLIQFTILIEKGPVVLHELIRCTGKIVHNPPSDEAQMCAGQGVMR